MLDLPDKATRQLLNAHSSFKAAVFSRTDSALFIESSARQAEESAALAGKPVVCTENAQLYRAGDLDRLAAKVRR
ncbi:phosphoribosyltransferase, partial [Citrobacter sp. AAK_AS5]